MRILTHHVHLAAPQVRYPRRWLRSQLVLKQPRPLHADGQRQGRHGHRLLCEIPPLYSRPCRLKPFNSQPGAILKFRNRLHGCSLELAKTAPEGCKTEGSAAACTGCSTSRSARLICFCYVLDSRQIALLLLCWKAKCPSLSNIAEAKQSENIGLLQRVHMKKYRQIFETKQILCNSSPAARQRGTSSCPHAGTV